jgi:hypothetical protein
MTAFAHGVGYIARIMEQDLGRRMFPQELPGHRVFIYSTVT